MPQLKTHFSFPAWFAMCLLAKTQQKNPLGTWLKDVLPWRRLSVPQAHSSGLYQAPENEKRAIAREAWQAYCL